MARTYTAEQGYVSVELAHCGLDHMTAAGLLFESDPGHFDSAGYLAHLGVELLLKAWLLEANRKFEGIHGLASLYAVLERECGAPSLDEQQTALLVVLDKYEQLRIQAESNLRRSVTAIGRELRRWWASSADLCRRRSMRRSVRWFPATRRAAYSCKSKSAPRATMSNSPLHRS